MTSSIAISTTCIKRVAASFRKGRCSSRANAAHVNNPLGGLGLNFGIHDAVEVTTLLGPRHPRRSPRRCPRSIRSAPPAVEHRIRPAADIANKKRMDEKDPAARQKDQEQLRRTRGRSGSAPRLCAPRFVDRKRQQARRRRGLTAAITES